MSAITQKGNDVPHLLRAAYPQHTVKRAAIAADVPTETAKKWLQGRGTPSASILLFMADRCDAIADALQRLLDDRRAARTADRDIPAAERVVPRQKGASA